jgi:ligand-binding sensor domain-containing protein/serine phosphatase RsbU (regulator of sigma subunit)/archaellum component FlaC
MFTCLLIINRALRPVFQKLSSVSLLILFFLSSAVSQNTQMVFNHFTDEDGLISNQVKTIYQDKQGFLWIGTATGLSRYDGYEFVNFEYEPENSNSLIGKEVQQIKEDLQGNLWIATNGGLNIYNPLFKSFTRYTHDAENPYSIIQNHVGCIVFQGKEKVWIGTNIGLQYFDRTSGQFLTIDNTAPSVHSLMDKELSDMLISGNTLWALTRQEKGIFELNTKTKKIKYHPIEGFYSQNNKYFCQSHSGRFIVLQEDGLVLNFNNSDMTETLIRPQQLDNQNRIKIFHDIKLIDNELWLGSNDGLYIYSLKNNKVRKYKHHDNNPKGISSNNVQFIFKDRFNSIWLASLETGIDVWHRDKQKFNSLYHRPNDMNSLSAGAILSIKEDKYHNFWIASDGYGLNRFNPQTNSIRHFIHDPDNPQNSLSNNAVLSVEILNNNIYTGHWAGGITRYNILNDTFGYLKHKPNNANSLPSDNVWHMTTDSKGRLLIATLNGGISFYDTKKNTFTNYTREPENPQSLNDTYVYFIYEDKQQTIWAGTAGHGLNKFNPQSGSFTHYVPDLDNRGSISNKTIRTIYEDSKNRFWIGTEAGLNLMDRREETFKVYYKKDGLCDNAIRHILEDNSGMLWITTANGLCKFNPENEVFTNFGIADGLLNKEFMPRSGTIASSGHIYLGGRKGVNYFHPDSMKTNTIEPRIVFTGLKIYNQPVNIGDSLNGRVILDTSITQTNELLLTYKEDIFSLSFSALHFLAPEKNMYKYKLEGYNNNWIKTEANQRYATFTNLTPGEYTLRVIAANNDGIWNNTGVSVKIIITPPWWETWWFRTSMIVLIIAGTLSFYFYRVNALKRQKQILEEKVTERTAELREANVELEERQEEILQQNEELQSKNDEIQKQKDEIGAQKEEIEASRDQLEKAFNNIKLLSEFGQKLTATFDFDTINSMIYDYVSSLMDTAAFGVGIFNERREIIDFPYFMEEGKPLPYFYKSLSNNQSLSVKCFKNMEEIIINDLSDEYKKYLKQLPDVKTSKIPESMIHLPLIVEGKAVGTITVNSYKKNAYNDTDVTNLRTLASYISIALDNSRAYRLVNRQKEQITGSIRYGKTIQQAMLPAKAQMEKYFENFLLYRPKDIVSGDFYWFSLVETHVRASLQEKPIIFLAVVDCTGHGVPGAFMSMIGIRLLNDIVNEYGIHSPAKILNELDLSVRRALRQDSTDNQDGMDVCLCRFQQVDNSGPWQLTYAGAKRPLIYFDSVYNEIKTIEGTRKSIGGFVSKNRNIEFKEQTLEVNNGDCIYLASDGYADQCNPQKRKFTQKKLVQILKENATKSIPEQGRILESSLDDFQKGFEQRDDITVVGLRIET